MRHARIPHKLIGKLHPMHLHVFAAIAVHANEEGAMWASPITIAAIAGVTREQAAAATSEMAHQGIMHRFGKGWRIAEQGECISLPESMLNADIDHRMLQVYAAETYMGTKASSRELASLIGVSHTTVRRAQIRLDLVAPERHAPGMSVVSAAEVNADPMSILQRVIELERTNRELSKRVMDLESLLEAPVVSESTLIAEAMLASGVLDEPEQAPALTLVTSESKTHPLEGVTPDQLIIGAYDHVKENDALKGDVLFEMLQRHYGLCRRRRWPNQRMWSHDKDSFRKRIRHLMRKEKFQLSDLFKMAAGVCMDTWAQRQSNVSWAIITKQTNGFGQRFIDMFEERCDEDAVFPYGINPNMRTEGGKGDSGERVTPWMKAGFNTEEGWREAMNAEAQPIEDDVECPF